MVVKFVKKLVKKSIHSNGVIQRLWYANGNPFRDEIRGVVAGNRSFVLSGGKSCEAALYTLRRNTHRIEKGLIMRPLRSVFALDYLAETVRAYRDLVSSDDSDNAESIRWATDVLEEYFGVVDRTHSNIISGAYEMFRASSDRMNSDKKLSPYCRDTSPLSFSVDQFRDLSVRRRSCRWYLEKKVPRELIDKAIEIARFAPSACNRQPFEFYIFDDPQKASDIGSIPMGTRGFSQQFPCFIVIVGKLSAFPHPRDRHVIYVDASLAAMSFQFALELMGIGSCCINWPEIPSLNHEMARKLKLKEYERVVMCMSIGYPDPDGKVPYSQKKPVEELRKYCS